MISAAAHLSVALEFWVSGNIECDRVINFLISSHNDSNRYCIWYFYEEQRKKKRKEMSRRCAPIYDTDSHKFYGKFSTWSASYRLISMLESQYCVSFSWIITCKMNLRLLIFPRRHWTPWQISLINKPNYWWDILRANKRCAMSSKCRCYCVLFVVLSSLFFLVYKSWQVAARKCLQKKKRTIILFGENDRNTSHLPGNQVQFCCHFQS